MQQARQVDCKAIRTLELGLLSTASISAVVGRWGSQGAPKAGTFPFDLGPCALPGSFVVTKMLTLYSLIAFFYFNHF